MATVQAERAATSSFLAERRGNEEYLQPNRELDTVLADVAEGMSASGVALALFPSGRTRQLLGSYNLAGERLASVLDLSERRGGEQVAGDFIWQSLPSLNDVLHILVDRSEAGHLIASFVFDEHSLARSDHGWRRHARLAASYLRQWRRNAECSGRDRALEVALDLTETGILLIDQSARVLFANAAAEDLIKCGDGISRSYGILRPMNLGDAVNFHAALSHVTRPCVDPTEVAAPLISFRRNKGAPLIASLLPTHVGRRSNDEQGALVSIIDPSFNTDRVLAPLCRLYGLSPVETALACRLAAGDTVAVAAAKMHVKEQTARTYLKQIFIKTGAKRQTELIVLMLSRVFRTKRNVVQMALGRTDGEYALTRTANAASCGTS